MNKAKLTFTRHKNSFSVHIENLETLPVPQIQELQNFVEQRKGIFDFDTYTFSIQKKLEFDDFVTLIQKCDIKATCRHNIPKTPQNIQVEFGKYKGMLYSELPDVYLLWLKGNYRGSQRGIVDAEVKSRNI